ncbi:hypothetical protein [Hyalangium rubrum]|uniref:Uncharacterized protein n=1 Tax=Hyalangium rubrum TaxID=3103134 RepID=A0ABU5H1Q2_9BACT|nr:hypothetical protein [Hyalangium sp. s54d21]MDY7226045.1 hypothetical protein [Hyalangium sp. s54d21]
MPPLPKWFEALKKDPKATEAGIRWFTPEESEAKRAELLRGYEAGDARTRLHLPEAAFTTAKTQVARFLPVAEGPATSDRSGHKHRGWLLLDKQAPSADELKVALAPSHPPFFWIGGGQTVASLKEVFASYFLTHVPSEDKLERTVRGFLGTGSVNKIDLIQLHDRYEASPFLDALAWGSAHKRDPFTLELMPKGHEGQDMARRFREQAPEGLATFTFRSLFSKSILRAEAHAGVADGVNVFVGQVRYRPARQAALIRDLNEKLGTKYPEDLPVDLAGALLGLPFDSPELIRAGLQKPPPPASINFGLLVLDCLAPDAATTEKDLREYASHADDSVRQTVANLALRRNLKALVSEMAGREQHPELKKQLGEAAQRLH